MSAQRAAPARLTRPAALVYPEGALLELCLALQQELLTLAGDAAARVPRPHLTLCAYDWHADPAAVARDLAATAPLLAPVVLRAERPYAAVLQRRRCVALSLTHDPSIIAARTALHGGPRLRRRPQAREVVWSPHITLLRFTCVDEHAWRTLEQRCDALALTPSPQPAWVAREVVLRALDGEARRETRFPLGACDLSTG